MTYPDANAKAGPNQIVTDAFVAQARLDRAAVERVDALHVESHRDPGWCDCGFSWPCPTARALRGES